MTDNEKIRSFGDMVQATEKLTKPWRLALIITNALWAIVFLAFILLAYLTPDTTYQVQNFEQQTQMQSSGTEVVTQGDRKSTRLNSSHIATSRMPSSA